MATASPCPSRAKRWRPATDAHVRGRRAGFVFRSPSPKGGSGAPERPLEPPGELAFGERRLAERAGFEPAVRFPVHTLSKRAP